MDKRRSDKKKPEASDQDILHRLNSVDAGAAWAEFLDRYAGLLMKTARQFEYQHDRSSECFLFVCERLAENGFRRLQQFSDSGPGSFRSWLGAVVFNLCVDWHRHEYGRATLLPAISALPAFDQAVYRLAFEQLLDKETVFQTLLADFPDLTRDLIDSSMKRVFSLLTPRQRWQITVQARRRKNRGMNHTTNVLDYLPDSGVGPEREVQNQQDLERLQSALKRISFEQRLLLSLRFQEGLSLKKIAELQQLGDTNRAWRHLQAALKALTRNMPARFSGKKRKN